MSNSTKVFLFCGLSILVMATRLFQPDISLKEILERLNEFKATHPQEKLYVHLDKPLYVAGEDIWFNCFLVNASSHKLDSLSKVVYVELFNENKKLVQRRTLYTPTGTSTGDFQLADTLSQGTYTLRAYTNSMKNSEEGFFFLKEITVLNPTSKVVTKETSPTLRDIQFFPEGGDLLLNRENRVAFKAFDNAGKGILVEGEIVDNNGKFILPFKSEHDGMGMFKFTPTTGSSFAKIKGTDQSFPLPDLTPQGYLLRATDTGASIKVSAYSNFSGTPAPQSLTVIAQAGGVVYFAAKGNTINSYLIFNLRKTQLPSGVVQITLFDEHGEPQCERLVFINHENTLEFSFQNNKASYGKREQVDLDIDVSTVTGESAQGTFSLSVYDETNIRDPKKYPISIVNYLMLTSDLKGYIEEPGYYLKDTLPDTKYHLDLLMMTHGWRRFAWSEVLGDTLSPPFYRPEQGIHLGGRVLTSSQKPSPGSKISIITTVGNMLDLTTDRDGRFFNDELIYFDSTELIIQTNDAKGRQKDLGFILDPFVSTLGLEFSPRPFEIIEAKIFLEQAEKRKTIINGYKVGKDVILLKEVEVRSTKIEEEPKVFKLYRSPDLSIKMKDIKYNPRSVFQVLQGRVAGVQVVGTYPYESIIIRGGGTSFSGSSPLYLLDGAPTDLSMIQTLPIDVVESVDVLKTRSVAMYGSRGSGGVVAVYTKRGHPPIEPPPSFGVHHVRYPGFFKAREFYSPDFASFKDEQVIPDIRNTLYWNPSITTNSTGTAHVSFYTSDVVSDYKIVMEGISVGGIPGVGTHKLVMRR